LKGLTDASGILTDKLNHVRNSIIEDKSHEENELNQTASLLTEMMVVIGQLETTSSELEHQSRELNNQISEVKSGVVY
jgi:hypothetical protein